MGAGRARRRKARTKPAARLEALERERFGRQQREGLAPSADNMRRTFGELMDLWQERYGSRLRSQTIKLSVEKHLRPALGKLLLGGAAAALPALLNSKIDELSPSTLNHLRACCHRLYAVASMRSVGWWMNPNPVNRLELPKFKEARRKRATVAGEEVPRVLSALAPEWAAALRDGVLPGHAARRAARSAEGRHRSARMDDHRPAVWRRRRHQGRRRRNGADP